MSELDFLHYSFDGAFTPFNLGEIPSKEDYFYQMVGRCYASKKLFKEIEGATAHPTTTLLLGGRGVGKKLGAKILAKLRGSGRLTVLRCSTLGEELWAEELLEGKGKRFFLQDIEKMSPTLQSKLLQVLTKDSSRIFPLIVSSTTSLEKKFCPKLYQQLKIKVIQFPSLLEQRENLPLLLSHFFTKHNPSFPIPLFSPKAKERIYSYSWPGNIRELETVVEQLISLKKGETIEEEDLPDKFFKKTSSDDSLATLPPEGIDLKSYLSKIENSLIDQALKITGGNKMQAALLLGINRTTLTEKIKKRKP